jgi:hypothetical protein
MAQQEPGIPAVKGDGIVENETIQNDAEKGNSNADKAAEAEQAKQDAKNREESSQVSDEQYKSLVDGWKEDREYLMGENKRLRAEAKNPKLTQKEEDELEGIDDPDERAEKKLEFRQRREKAAEEAELKTVKSEIRFYERTDKEFAENKKDILKVASDYECKDLKQAILVWRGLNATKAKKDADYHDERKKGADGKGGGNSGGTTTGKPYDPKEDSKKSFGDLYREGLGK